MSLEGKGDGGEGRTDCTGQQNSTYFMVTKIKDPFFEVTCGAEHEYGIRKGILDQILVIQ